MKLLLINGSYRKNGNTDQILELIHTELEQLSAQSQVSLEIESISLARLDLAPCRGCRACFDRGEEKCPVKDQMSEIRAKMRDADGLVIACPVYVNDVNGITKTWIDRMAYACHRPEFAGKCAYLIATVGSGPTSHAMQTLQFALSSWGYHITGKAGLKMGAITRPPETQEKFQTQASKAAQAIFTALGKQKVLNPSFMSLMIFRIQQKSWRRNGDPQSVDYLYWKDKGWLEEKRNFYIEHRANPFKTGLARLAGIILYPFVT